MSNATRVLDFHTAIGKTMPASPTPPGPADLQLRLTLLREEMAEVEEAAAQLTRLNSPAVRDLAPLAHELVDLLYVTYGALLSLGVDPDQAFEEVHRANMLKSSGPRRADGKQLKPAGWQPADLTRLLESGR
ncbi:hypothetical protein [Deinococcus sonorensis]|uniref:HAD family hydrolase n=2 Tax=Deinococcus sonorensis TaxID=309891 RepID=A0AAU7UAC1_9DEIO